MRTLLLGLLSIAVLRGDGFIPHLAAGYGWITTVTLVNTTSFSQPTTVWFWADDGSALTLPVTGLGPSTGFTITLPANGVGSAEVTGPSDRVIQGYATVVGKVVTGNAIFIWKTTPVYEAAVPISSLVQRLVFPFDNSNGYLTAIAFVNTVADWRPRVTIRDALGNIMTQTTAPSIPLHRAYQMRDVYPESNGIVGTIEFESFDSDGNPQAAITAIALRFNPTGPLTTITPVYAGNF